ncbi:hypothetical protein NC653_026938 [Populus alba x Populus x berolinensis]|uniref:Uncharacterized protein n=1 Tax=Populus alba x Populus x berolinensis TaxID=444605 RepID=A0AAD6M4C4_9ROSI|nr:hypothetical protein NC653_026938 [Populus alba x Populus x berolinensis]
MNTSAYWCAVDLELSTLILQFLFFCPDLCKVLSLLDSKWLLRNIKNPTLLGFLIVNIKCS